MGSEELEEGWVQRERGKYLRFLFGEKKAKKLLVSSTGDSLKIDAATCF